MFEAARRGDALHKNVVPLRRRRERGLRLEPYRCGVGGHRRLTRLHALPACGKKRWLRAFTVEPFASVQEDLDTRTARGPHCKSGRAARRDGEPLRRRRRRGVAQAAAGHDEARAHGRAAAQEEDEAAAAAVLADAAPPPPPEDNAPVVASFPTAFGWSRPEDEA